MTISRLDDTIRSGRSPEGCGECNSFRSRLMYHVGEKRHPEKVIREETTIRGKLSGGISTVAVSSGDSTPVQFAPGVESVCVYTMYQCRFTPGVFILPLPSSVFFTPAGFLMTLCEENSRIRLTRYPCLVRLSARILVNPENNNRNFCL